ncbi:MAG: ATP synthase F1 subunit epsilon [Acutalibacter sp.]|jgi:F-type H+-transporting ATPase subunit epsilon
MASTSTFYLEMVSPQNIFFSGMCKQIILPGLDGSYGVLPGHEPMVTAITAGIVRFQDEEGRWHICVASDGCVEVMPERVILLAAAIERPEDIDQKRAEAAKQRAEERLRQKQSQREYYQTQAALSRALARLKAKSAR